MNSTEFHKSLNIVITHFIQDFMHSMKELGLSTPQIHALMYIYHAGESQVSDIGALADVSKAAASQLVERLVVQGFVERREDPTNRRAKILRLTEKGKGIIQGGLSSLRFQEIMASLTPNQRETVHEAFHILVQAAQHNQNMDKPKDYTHA